MISLLIKVILTIYIKLNILKSFYDFYDFNQNSTNPVVIHIIKIFLDCTILF